MGKITLVNDEDVRKTKRVYVEWIDSVCIRGWNHESLLTDEYAEPSKICSVGFLIKDTKNYVTISTSVSVNGSVTDPLTIPKCAITKIQRLK